MKAMIFAAGRGQRMRPLTDHTPKPLLQTGGQPLIAWHLQRLAAAGVREVVINTAHLAEQFPEALGDGSRWGLAIHYLREPEGALETGGGVLNALPWLGPEPFVLVSGDIWCALDPAALPHQPAGKAHVVLVDNPPHHRQGDFLLDADGKVRSPASDADTSTLTYAGIAVCRPALLDDWQTVIGECNGARASPPRFALAPLLYAAADAGMLTGQHHRGPWSDIGTPQRLQALRDQLAGD